METKPEKTVLTDGTEEWYLNARLHRTDGPAVTLPEGTERWYLNGKRHRPDGPAVIWSDGINEWWFDGTRILIGDGQLNALYAADRIDELRLILETWTPDGPTIDELAAAIERTPA